MTLSVAQRAVLEDLLELARSNERFFDHDVVMHLPASAFAKYRAIKLERENEMQPRHDELVWELYRSGPPDLDGYRDSDKIDRDAYSKASTALPKLYAKRAEIDATIARHEATVAEKLPEAWKRFDALTKEQKLWFGPHRNRNVWPPSIVNEAPMEVVLSGEEMPASHALRRVVEELLRDE